jgi:hypothetical protein
MSVMIDRPPVPVVEETVLPAPSSTLRRRLPVLTDDSARQADVVGQAKRVVPSNADDRTDDDDGDDRAKERDENGGGGHGRSSSSSSGSDRPVSTDPILQFSALPPPALREAQRAFVRSLEEMARCVTVLHKLQGLETAIGAAKVTPPHVYDDARPAAGRRPSPDGL